MVDGAPRLDSGASGAVWMPMPGGSGKELERMT
jgi:hypothetical protein